MSLALVPVLVLGVIQAGLYSLLPIALVLTYRVSRTIAFVHGGIAATAALIYWKLTYTTVLLPGIGWPPLKALALVVAIGTAVGGLYGAFVTSSRVARVSSMTLTILSLGAMLLVMGVFTTVLEVPPYLVAPSPFGGNTVTISGFVVTNLKFVTLCLSAGLVAALAAFLNLTRSGRHLQALSDDLEAAGWCGVNVARIGTFVYVVAGAISGLAGGLISATVGPDPTMFILLLLRALTVAIIGGLVSLPLALAGALVLSVAQVSLETGVFGDLSLGSQELLLNMTLLLMIVVIARRRGQSFYLLNRQSL